MAYLTRDQVKAVVVDSLRPIADIPGNVEEATFTMLNDAQKQIFLTALKKNLNAHPYQMSDGTTSNAAYYDVDLNAGSIAGWPKVKDCIDWIVANQKVVYN